MTIRDTFVATTDPASSELVERARRNRNDAGMDADFDIGPRLFLGLDVTHTTHYYMWDHLADLLNRKEMSAGPSVGIRIGPKTRSYVRYAYQDIAYDFNLSTKDNLTHNILVGAEGEFGSRMTGTVEAGVFMRDYETTSSTTMTDSITSPAARLEIEWAGPRDLKVSLMGSRGPREALFNRFYTSNTIGIGVSKEMKRRWTAGFLGSYGMDEYPDVLFLGTANEERKDGILQIGFNIGYDANEWLSVKASYLYRSRDSNLDEFDYDDRIASLGAHFDY